MRKTSLKQLVLCACVCFLSISCVTQSSSVDFDLIPVQMGEQWGFVNHKGEYVINPQFIYANYFREGLACVKTTAGKVGFITPDGNFAIEAKYLDATPFFEGRAFVLNDSNIIVCIEQSGNECFTLEKYKQAYNYTDGLALFVDKNNKAGYIDKNGTVIIEPQFEWVYKFTEGLAGVKKDGKWGYINTKGEIVIEPQFDQITHFSEGKAGVRFGEHNGIIDTKGKIIGQMQFENVVTFHNGLSAIQQNGKYGYIDGTGKIVIDPQFDFGYSFENGLAEVKLGDSWGYIDKKGKFVINPQFDDRTSFIGNIAFVKKNGKWGIIDKKGNYIAKPQFDNVFRPPFLAIEWWLVGVNDNNLVSTSGDFKTEEDFLNALNSIFQKTIKTFSDMFEKGLISEEDYHKNVNQTLEAQIKNAQKNTISKFEVVFDDTEDKE